MAKPLTAIAIQNLKPRAKRYEVSDPGCPGLRVCVFPTRAKSFILRFRYRGQQKKLTLGPLLAGGAEPAGHPAIGAPQTLASARMLATTALREAHAGIDPTSAVRQRKEQERAAEGDTFENVAQEF